MCISAFVLDGTTVDDLAVEVQFQAFLECTGQRVTNSYPYFIFPLVLNRLGEFCFSH